MTPRYVAPDGYIYDQAATAGEKYGLCDSAKTGCGWIAACNLFNALGQTPDYAAVRRSLARTLLFGGAIGTSLPLLLIWLRRKGVRLRAGLAGRRARAGLRGAKAGVVWYFTGRGLHYAAFRRTGPGVFQFYNAVYGEKCTVCTLPEFCRRHSKAPFIAVFGVK